MLRNSEFDGARAGYRREGNDTGLGNSILVLLPSADSAGAADFHFESRIQHEGRLTPKTLPATTSNQPVRFRSADTPDLWTRSFSKRFLLIALAGVCVYLCVQGQPRCGSLAYRSQSIRHYPGLPLRVILTMTFHPPFHDRTINLKLRSIRRASRFKLTYPWQLKFDNSVFSYEVAYLRGEIYRGSDSIRHTHARMISSGIVSRK